MSQNTLHKLNNHSYRLDVVVEPDEVEKALNKARLVVGELASRPLGEKQLGQDPEQTKDNAVRSRATRAIAEAAIAEAIESRGLRLTANPQSSLESLVTPGKPYEFSITLEVVPEFELEDFDTLAVVYDDDVTVSDEEIAGRLEEIQGRAGSVEKDSGKPIGLNDIVEISFESFIDGEPYEGSVISNYTYTLGSLYLPEAFEEGLLGLHAGDQASIEFVVPKDYGNDEIAGKLARFDVSVNRVSSITLPEVNDGFAQEFGYENLNAWKEKIRGELEEQKQWQIQERKEKAARDALAARLKGHPDSAMIDAAAGRMLEAFKQDLKSQGLDFEEYCRFLGIREADVREEMRDEAEVMLVENLALEALFRKLGFTITTAELDKTVQELAMESAISAPEGYKGFSKEQQGAVREMTMHRMATDWLMDHCEFSTR